MQKLKSVCKLKLHFVDANESQRAKSTCTTPKTPTETKSKPYLVFSNCCFSTSIFTDMEASELHLVSLMVHLTTPVIFHNSILSRSEITSTLMIKSNGNSSFATGSLKYLIKRHIQCMKMSTENSYKIEHLNCFSS